MKNYTCDEIKEISAVDFYPLVDLARDKIDAIYALFGIEIDKNHDTLETINYLIDDCLKVLRKNKDAEPRIETGRIIVEMNVGSKENCDENEIKLGITFRIAEN